jgi:hypothetical protein
MSETVALILQMESAIAFEAIARCMPVWIAGTPEHAHLKRLMEILANPPAVTWFPLKEGETLEEAAVRISFSLDDHHNQLAQKEGYKFLLVFGAKYAESMAAELGEIEFTTFESTEFGFVAAKSSMLST